MSDVGGADPGAGGLPARSVSSTELERVFRRASELQFDSGSEPSVLATEEVVRIGEEVGLEPHHVRRAIAEVYAQSLLPALPADAGLPTRLWGPGIVRHSRAVRGDPASVQEAVERHFRDKESLKRVRHQAGSSLWEPATGLLKQMQRALDVGGHGYELTKAGNVQLAVEGLEEGWSLVTIAADLRKVRAEQASGWLAFLGLTGGAGAALLVATAGAAGIALAPVVVAGMLGTGSWAAARNTGKVRDRLELVILGLLDRLEEGELGRPAEGPAWRDWLPQGGSWTGSE